MARDQILLGLYEAMHGRFPEGLAGAVIEGVDLNEVTDHISGVASHYVNSTKRLTADHRSWLEESVADIEAIENLLQDEYALEYFRRHRALARYLLLAR